MWTWGSKDIANEIPDAFMNTKSTDSYISTANIPTRIKIAVTSLRDKGLKNKPWRKCRRPIGAKDSSP